MRSRSALQAQLHLGLQPIFDIATGFPTPTMPQLVCEKSDLLRVRHDDLWLAAVRIVSLGFLS